MIFTCLQVSLWSFYYHYNYSQRPLTQFHGITQQGHKMQICIFKYRFSFPFVANCCCFFLFRILVQMKNTVFVSSQFVLYITKNWWFCKDRCRVQQERGILLPPTLTNLKKATFESLLNYFRYFPYISLPTLIVFELGHNIACTSLHLQLACQSLLFRQNNVM